MGHQAGDRLLKQVAEAIVAASRDSDRVFRYGGDEFAVLLPRTDGRPGRHRSPSVCGPPSRAWSRTAPSGAARRGHSTRRPGPPRIPVDGDARGGGAPRRRPGAVRREAGRRRPRRGRRPRARRWPASSRSSPRPRSTRSRAPRPDRRRDRRAGWPPRVTLGAMIYEPPERVRPRRPRSTLDSPILAGVLVAGRDRDHRGDRAHAGPAAVDRRARPEPGRGAADRHAGRADAGGDLRPADAEPAADVPHLQGQGRRHPELDREAVRHHRSLDRLVEPRLLPVPRPGVHRDYDPNTIRVGWVLVVLPRRDRRRREPAGPASARRGRRRARAGPRRSRAGGTGWVRASRGAANSSAGGPSSRIRPPSRKHTRSATSRAKPISWVAMTIVMPPVASSRTTSSTSATSSGSSALVISSRSRRSGCIASARTIATRCCWPPDSRSG